MQGLPLSGHLHVLATGDLNRDGYMDLVAGSSIPTGHDVIIWYGEGNGTWKKMVKLPVYGSVHSLAIGDINNDGRDDICLSIRDGTEGIAIWLNKGEDFWEIFNSPTRSGLYEGLFLYDFDKDQRLDILAANYSLPDGMPGGIHLWLNDNGDDWTDNMGPIAEGRFINIEVADFNLDGIPDIAGTSWGPNGKLMVWLGRKGMQNWATMSPLEQGDFWGIKAADLNNDSIPDLLVTTYKKGIRIYYGDGNGNFSPPQIVIDTGYFWKVLSCDLNNDGCVDILASSFDDHGIHMWIGRGDCQREEYKKWVNKHGDMKIRTMEWKPVHGLLPNFGSYFDMLLGDFNDDGAMDLAAAHKGQGVKVWLNVMNSEQAPKQKAESDKNLAEPVATQEEIEEKIEEKKEEPSKSSDVLLSNARFEEHFLNGNGRRNRRGPQDTKKNENQSKNDQQDQKREDIRAKEDVLTSAKGPSEKHTLQMVMAENISQEKGNQVFRMIEGVPEYIIGAGDTVEITFWEGMDSRVFTIPVRTNGTITTPFFEDFKIEGLTTVEADRILTKRLRRFIHNPRIDVRTVEFHSKKATVLGAVSRPGPARGAGTYYLTGKTRVLDLIAEAGGPSSDADLRRIEIIQKGIPRKINLYSAIFHGDPSQNIIVDNNDVIFLPKMVDTSSKVYLFGEVKAPGIYPFSTSLTLLDAIAKAGGFGKDARMESVKVVRGDISNPEIISCDLSQIIKKGDITKNVLLENNDLIYIPKSHIANLKLFAEKIDSLLKLVLYPVALVNTAKDPDELDLRLDIGF